MKDAGIAHCDAVSESVLEQHTYLWQHVDNLATASK